MTKAQEQVVDATIERVQREEARDLARYVAHMTEHLRSTLKVCERAMDHDATDVNDVRGMLELLDDCLERMTDKAFTLHDYLTKLSQQERAKILAAVVPAEASAQPKWTRKPCGKLTRKRKAVRS